MPEFITAARRMVALLAVLIVFALVACGDSHDDSNPAGQTPSTESTGGGTAATDNGKATVDKSDGGASDGGPQIDEDRGEDSASGAAATEEQSIEATVEGMYADLAAGDAEGVCSAMSTSARAQIAQQVPGGTADKPSERTCSKSLARFIDVASKSGALASTLGAAVQRVEIEGAVATVGVSFKGSPAGRIRLTREDGEWRFGPRAVTGR